MEFDPNKAYICSGNKISKGFNELMYYVTKSDIKKVKEILEIDPKCINHQNDRKWTALMIASIDSKKYGENMVKLLLNHGADPNLQEENGWTALHMAVRHSKDDSTENTVKMLLENGADPNIKNGTKKDKDKMRYSALDLASEFATENVVQLLLDHGAIIYDEARKYLDPKFIEHNENQKIQRMINDSLQKFKRELMEELMEELYAPGGPGAKMAQNHFDSLK